MFVSKIKLSIPALGLALALAIPSVFAGDAIPYQWSDVARIVAVGDIHGDYDNYRAVLLEAGVIDKRGKWVAGKTHLVQVGDVPDRGPDTLKIIKHLQQLEKQADKKGGKVHVLIGNHEFMNATGDLRYVHPGEYEAFKTKRSKAYLDGYYQQVVSVLESRRAQMPEGEAEPPIIDAVFKETWYRDHPPGYVEHRIAWQSQGEINQWVAQHNSVIRINDVLFMHGGLGPSMLSRSLAEINDSIRQEVAGAYDSTASLGDASEGPLWYRGLARNPEAEEQPHLDALLASYDVEVVVLGHTPDLGVITPRFGGKVIIIDTGISAHYGAHRASLLIEGESRKALHGEHYTPLPTDEDSMLVYFEGLLAAQPKNAKVAAHIETLRSTDVSEQP